ncbi:MULTISPECIES: type II toxin-antitoxin system VapB family antitoxin [Micrococcaceae]|uniref:type II toxin-antitoxin system VapB family antitoxin n=1 Tax=Micrococcaceae TaxID=1268 RepID=UPI00081764EF|nr:type II toxin-antitoxin system VapB family antitoxin [Arthrobacter sp. NIO-1057]SCC39424.1 Transcription regulator of the Arc/MetJ class [Arthrobacter sp. NIO-1057]
MIFRAVGDKRPYPEHGLVSSRDWSELAPQQVKLDQLVTTKSTLDLETLLSEDSTFYGDLFPHVVRYQGVLYLEDGVHRALRSALHHRSVIHARILDLDDDSIS